jgi:hypothetical protein
MMDQFNILERHRFENLETFQFLVSLRNIFGRYFVGASNNNATLNLLNELIAEEIYLSAHQIFTNYDEALEYLNFVGYFPTALSKPNDVKANLAKIKEYTHFNLLELLKLNESFKLSKTKAIDDNFRTPPIC